MEASSSALVGPKDMSLVARKCAGGTLGRDACVGTGPVLVHVLVLVGEG